MKYGAVEVIVNSHDMRGSVGREWKISETVVQQQCYGSSATMM